MLERAARIEKVTPTLRVGVAGDRDYEFRRMGGKRRSATADARVNADVNGSKGGGASWLARWSVEGREEKRTREEEEARYMKDGKRQGGRRDDEEGFKTFLRGEDGPRRYGSEGTSESDRREPVRTQRESSGMQERAGRGRSEYESSDREDRVRVGDGGRESAGRGRQGAWFELRDSGETRGERRDEDTRRVETKEVRRWWVRRH